MPAGQSVLDGPRLAPASGGRPDRLVVFLHGYGADGQDLIGLGAQWARVMPSAAFLAPNAPERCAMSPMGYQWWGIARRSPDEAEAGVLAAAPLLDAFLDAELTRAGLPPEALALVGFSQGTMMALHVGLRRRAGPAAILGYSGALVAPARLAAELTARPPVFLVHGDQDEVIPPAATQLAAAELGRAGLSVQWHISQGIGHGIAPDGLALGARFLKDAFAAALARQAGG
ncbi:MAG: prolyl oligopeptidase family serine peptidase [Alphaproteobacteria bacterium]|nr:prolyl oligopeptidase family serine peptidase [Alphaproteobacteria bacterium]